MLGIMSMWGTGNQAMSEGEEVHLESQERAPRIGPTVGGEGGTGRKEVKRWLKLVQPYQFQEERAKGAVKEFDLKFDKYKTGPMVEDIVDVYKELCAQF
jgi:hypothetical protein